MSVATASKSEDSSNSSNKGTGGHMNNGTMNNDEETILQKNVPAIVNLNGNKAAGELENYPEEPLYAERLANNDSDNLDFVFHVAKPDPLICSYCGNELCKWTLYAVEAYQYHEMTKHSGADHNVSIP